MANLWRARHSEDVQLWTNLLIETFPNILFFIEDTDIAFGSNSAFDEITIASPFVIRDLLLALEQSQGYLFIPTSLNQGSLTSYWFYLDEYKNPSILSIYSKSREEGYFKKPRLKDVLENLLVHDEIFIEYGADDLIRLLIKLGKKIYLLPDYNQGIYDELEEIAVDEDAMVQTIFSFEEVAEGPSLQIWTLNESYPEVALLKTPGKYCLITTLESGYDHIFNYATSSNFDDIYLILISL